MDLLPMPAHVAYLIVGHNYQMPSDEISLTVNPFCSNVHPMEARPSGGIVPKPEKLLLGFINKTSITKSLIIRWNLA